MEMNCQPEMRLTLELEAETPPDVYLTWRDDLLLDIYADRDAAEQALADVRADYPRDWQQLPTGTWFVPGSYMTLRVEARPLLSSVHTIHADGATRASDEAL